MLVMEQGKKCLLSSLLVIKLWDLHTMTDSAIVP